MNNVINKIVQYRLECIKHEDFLVKDIPSNEILCPLNHDLFVFDRGDNKVHIIDEKILEFLKNSKIQNNEVYYGYPLLFYFDSKTQKNYVAPLFAIKIGFDRDQEGVFLHREDPIPVCGIQALNKIGLKIEEIPELNKDLQNVFKDDISDSSIIAKKCIDLLLEEAKFSINEDIKPELLTNTQQFTKNAQVGVYNKSMIFSDNGKNQGFNVSLIKDLNDLKSKSDINQTSLSLINEEVNNQNKIKFGKPLVLPFPVNDYQVGAIKSVFENRVSVVTGPPGTGKSQFIMNLLINLFLNNKTVLFVSHTNEAVDIVDREINKNFRNLLLRTGNKEFRQGLTKKFNELSLDSQKNFRNSASIEGIGILWYKIIDLKKDILKIDKLEQRVTELIQLRKLKKNVFTFFKYKFFLWKLKKMPSKINLEKEIKNLEKDYFSLSKEYVQAIYAKNILKNWGASNKAKDFLYEIENTKFNEDISEYSFMRAFDVLKIWSSTLKSLNRTFPLKAGIFDYVIFDEASQVDLPSAAPAMYRAKNVVVVGDPMQLSHITSITKDLDKEIAKKHGLDRYEGLYPSKIRYSDVSLYRCAESLLDKPPILLAKHYRSEDQIIALCNKVFYNDRLDISSNLNYDNRPESLPLGIKWEDISGIVTKINGGSRVNKNEVSKVNEVFQDILKEIDQTKLTIGIVTPYAEQQKQIYKIISEKTPAEVLEKHDVKVLTAHQFQGSEKDIMIFSMVLSSKGDGNSDRWYNSNQQILNVALSRAKYLLYIVGDKKFCLQKSSEGILKKIAENYEKIKKEEGLEEQYFSGKFDSNAELQLYQRLQNLDLESFGYKLIPKFNEKRYILDFALIGNGKKIDIECDGFGNHNIIDGLPVIEDIERDYFLEKREWEVLRFPNYQIFININKVIDKIKKSMKEI